MKQSPTQSTYLAAAVWPGSGLLRDVALILAGSLLIALSAQITLPLWPVPVTGQTFGVLLVAALLGRRGALSVAAYLFEGALGLPFFAGGTAGVAVLAGPTAGYLVGFIAAAYVVGLLCEKSWDRRVGTAVVAMLIGTAVIYGFGVPWLARFTGWNQALQLGLLPFLPGDVLKVIAAAVALPVGWKLLGK